MRRITESAEMTIFKTAGGNFESSSKISIPDSMLPCFTAQQSFKVVFNVMPKEVSIDSTYGVIISQNTMRELKIDRSVLTNSITWVVPRRYWSHKTIILNGEKLSQPPSQNLSNVEVPNGRAILHLKYHSQRHSEPCRGRHSGNAQDLQRPTEPN